MHVAKPEADSVLSAPRVLLIEDDEAVAQAMVRGIERSGMSVVCAGARDGAQVQLHAGHCTGRS